MLSSDKLSSVSHTPTAQESHVSDGMIPCSPPMQRVDDGPEPVLLGSAGSPTQYNQGYPPHLYGTPVKGDWYGQPQPPEPEKRTCGLRRTTLILVVALILVIIAAAIGGGVGGTMAVRNAREQAFQEGFQEASAVYASSTSSPYAAPTDVTVVLDCPALDDRRSSVDFENNSYYFESRCGFSRRAFEPERPIIAIVSYSFDDCLRACAAYNEYLGNNTCTTVNFMADLTVLEAARGNCHLFDSDVPPMERPDLADIEISATLVEDGREE